MVQFEFIGKSHVQLCHLRSVVPSSIPRSVHLPASCDPRFRFTGSSGGPMLALLILLWAYKCILIDLFLVYK